jgi:hypothetical protein
MDNAEQETIVLKGFKRLTLQGVNQTRVGFTMVPVGHIGTCSAFLQKNHLGPCMS